MATREMAGLSVDQLTGFFLMEAFGEPWRCACCIGEDDGAYRMRRARAVCPWAKGGYQEAPLSLSAAVLAGVGPSSH